MAEHKLFVSSLVTCSGTLAYPFFEVICSPFAVRSVIITRTVLCDEGCRLISLFYIQSGQTVCLRFTHTLLYRARSSDMQFPISKAMVHCDGKWELHEE